MGVARHSRSCVPASDAKDFAQSPKGEQVKLEVKEQAGKPENRRKLKEFGQHHQAAVVPFAGVDRFYSRPEIL